MANFRGAIDDQVRPHRPAGTDGHSGTRYIARRSRYGNGSQGTSDNDLRPIAGALGALVLAGACWGVIGVALWALDLF